MDVVNSFNSYQDTLVLDTSDGDREFLLNDIKCYSIVASPNLFSWFLFWFAMSGNGYFNDPVLKRPVLRLYLGSGIVLKYKCSVKFDVKKFKELKLSTKSLWC